MFLLSYFKKKVKNCIHYSPVRKLCNRQSKMNLNKKFLYWYRNFFKCVYVCEWGGGYIKGVDTQ